MKRKNIVILFSRLSGYMLNTFVNFVENNNIDLHVVKKNPDVKEAPFKFDLKINNITFYNQDQFNKKELVDFVKSLAPELIICSGWSNSNYNYVIAKLRKIIPCTLTMDNQYHGTIKQKLGIIYSKIFIVPKYKNIWVPGLPQKNYALKLGFKEKNIFQGWYVANHQCFLRESKITQVSKKFVFVGRYIEIKGLYDLCDAFIKATKQIDSAWELHCIGAGPLKDKLPQHEKIKHLGFLQPNELQEYSKDVGVFVLPSHFEPWGVVVQEFALAGFPLLISDKVGAASHFVSSNNGLLHKAGNVESLKKTLLRFISMKEDTLVEMANSSIHLGKSINSAQWSKTLNGFLR